jgi:NTP pyrophosphatase (non-canonical NTP hydrolase)
MSERSNEIDERVKDQLQKGLRLNIRDYQQQTRMWRNANFPPEHRNSMSQALGVAEESGELAHAVLKLVQGIRGSESEHLLEAADALGDLFIYMCGAADALQLDLEDCIDNAWREVKRRNWKENPDDGTPNA